MWRRMRVPELATLPLVVVLGVLAVRMVVISDIASMSPRASRMRRIETEPRRLRA